MMRDVLVVRAPVIEVGSCNGCTERRDKAVLVISLRGTSIRLCRACWHLVQEGVSNA
jgi:hypothetical protein